MVKRDLIYRIHTPLEQMLHAKRVQGEVGRDRIPLYSSPSATINDSSIIAHWFLTSGTWPPFECGSGGGREESIKKNFIFNQNNFSPHIHTFLYTQTTNH
jgi:hypothetical protein